MLEQFYRKQPVHKPDYIYPLIFVGKNDCIHCGGEDTIAFFSPRNYILKNDSLKIQEIDRAICVRCNREYIIKWTENGEMSFVENDVKKQYLEFKN